MKRKIPYLLYLSHKRQNFYTVICFLGLSSHLTRTLRSCSPYTSLVKSKIPCLLYLPHKAQDTLFPAPISQKVRCLDHHLSLRSQFIPHRQQSLSPLKINNFTAVGFHVKCLLFLRDFNHNHVSSNSGRDPNMKFHNK